MGLQSVGNPLFNVSRGLVLRDCDEGILVFDEMNGKTFLLNTQAGQVLRALISRRNLSESTLWTFSDIDADYNAPEFQDLISALQDSELVGS